MVCGISNLEAGIRSTSALGVGGELNESPNPEWLDRPLPNLEVGLKAFGFGLAPNESLNPELADPCGRGAVGNPKASRLPEGAGGLGEDLSPVTCSCALGAVTVDAGDGMEGGVGKGSCLGLSESRVGLPLR